MLLKIVLHVDIDSISKVGFCFSGLISICVLDQQLIIAPCIHYDVCAKDGVSNKSTIMNVFVHCEFGVK